MGRALRALGIVSLVIFIVLIVASIVTVIAVFASRSQNSSTSPTDSTSAVSDTSDSPPGQPDSSDSTRAPAQTAAVATDVPECSEMAREVLESDGTAVDAAITAMLCVGVVNPQSSGIGGGGFMVVFDPKKQSMHSFNFREMAPAATTPNLMFDLNPSDTTTRGLAVAVPGEVAGMKVAHEHFGRLPWKQLFQPVVDLSQNGFDLTEHAAKAIAKSAQYLEDDPVFDKWFYNSQGLLKQAGDLVQRPEYADVLNMIANEGPEILYNGSIAAEIVEAVTNHGGIMTLDDLASYHTRQDPPLSTTYSGMEVYAPPVPAGGTNLLFSLNVMQMMNLSPQSPNADVTYQRLVETFKYMFAKRSYLGDPHCPDCASESEAILGNQTEMISEDYALFINQQISDTQTLSPMEYYLHYVPPDGGTAHISVIDSEGMAVSVTTTINKYFGAKIITSSGIVLNNQMADFTPLSSNATPEPKPDMANLARSMRRPLSSTCPTIVLKDNGVEKVPYFVIGAAGGPHIPTALTQVSLGVLSYGWSLSDAIEEKRLHVKFDSTAATVYYESGFSPSVINYLISLGHTVMQDDDNIAAVQGVIKYANGNVEAHSDSRKM